METKHRAGGRGSRAAKRAQGGNNKLTAEAQSRRHQYRGSRGGVMEAVLKAADGPFSGFAFVDGKVVKVRIKNEAHWSGAPEISPELRTVREAINQLEARLHQAQGLFKAHTELHEAEVPPTGSEVSGIGALGEDVMKGLWGIHRTLFGAGLLYPERAAANGGAR